MKMKTVGAILFCAALAGVGASYYVKHANKTVDYEGAQLPFTWQNTNLYFVITDRFKNGDKTNDNSYGRPSVDSAGYNAGTFHGGDFKGLTQQLDYIRSLGVNAIWVSSPVEQSHGWVGGGPMGLYQYYAYHGYYGLDFTSIDANMGTVDDFRTFVNEAHKRGIRVLIDIVMNHSGYATLKDMCDFNFGRTTHGEDPCKEWVPTKEMGQTFHDKPIDASFDSSWNNWWGKDWILFDGYGEPCGAEDGLDKCLAYLPDFKNTNPNGPAVKLPEFLTKKWSTPNAKYDIPAAIPFRSGSMSVAQFQAHWLASWVEEFGIDGFRCDTVKYVSLDTWKLLKTYCVEALEKWRAKNKGKDPAANWTDPFYMTGELWAFTNDPEDKSGFAKDGGFDSLIDFYFNPDGVNLNTCILPDQSDWEKYGKLYGRLEGSVPLGNMAYISSHDTSLCRKKDMAKAAYNFLLLPGSVQIYYGDETSRVNDMGGGIDLEQGIRSDMNFPKDIDNQSLWAADVATLSKTYSADPILATWQKVGQFRLRNPAVGAGLQEKLDDGSYCRRFKDPAKGIDNAVVIHVGEAKSVQVGKCFANGDKLQDGFTGKTYTVENGAVTIDVEKIALLEKQR
ncbi:MAG: alpha-amylase [Aeromonadales bacterium]|nr:alpha-amylase [Aeromonadales bacterium]